jgi:hypothetical protein
MMIGMGFYVGVVFSMPTDGPPNARQGIIDAARTTLSAVGAVDSSDPAFQDQPQVCALLLRIVDDFDGLVQQGGKGSLLLWGGIFNSFSGRDGIPRNELAVLRTFLENVWLHRATWHWNRALLLVEPEKDEDGNEDAPTHIFELGFDHKPQSGSGHSDNPPTVRVRHLHIPFGWKRFEDTDNSGLELTD